MSSFLDNLRPGERRLVVVIAVVLIVVLNVIFVWPHFGDWNRTMRDLQGVRVDYTNYVKKIDLDTKSGGFKDQLKKLEDQDSVIGTLANELQLQKTIMNQAKEAGVNVSNYSPAQRSASQNNDYFEELSIGITIDCGEKELVDFLYNVGNDSSMIRVRQLNLRPFDNNRYRLRGNITLAANYQKKAPEKPAQPAPAVAKAAATPRPAPVPSPKKPAK